VLLLTLLEALQLLAGILAFLPAYQLAVRL
jgi:hypothetical protein